MPGICTTKALSRFWTMSRGWRPVHSVYIIGQMHPERRPETSATYPHNPVRPLLVAEDARANWRFDARALWAHQAAALRLRVAGRHRLDARIRRCGTQTRSTHQASGSPTRWSTNSVWRASLPIWRTAISTERLPMCAIGFAHFLPQPARRPRVCRQRVFRGRRKVSGRLGRIGDSVNGRGGGAAALHVAAEHVCAQPARRPRHVFGVDLRKSRRPC